MDVENKNNDSPLGKYFNKQRALKLKICGMKDFENIKEVSALQPDYLGFIFYPQSKRNFSGEIPKISDKIIKTGVFVNESIDFIVKKVKEYDLKAIQLHGDENPKYCADLQSIKYFFESDKMNLNQVQIIKVFSVGEIFDFSILKDYEGVCDYFLFDTKGKEKGGNGITFNWKQLKNYPSDKPYFLSGGIGLEEVEDIDEFFNTKASEKCFAIDVNSKFEDKSGLKNLEKLKLFIEGLKL